jgi:putative inorganic carbon (HCO3(-)) transporter
LNRVWNLVRKDGIFIGLLALILGVPLVCSPYTQSNAFLIKTVFLQSLVFALFLLWLGRKFLSKEPASNIPLKLPMVSFLAVGALWLAFSSYRYAVFEEFLRFLSFFLLYVLIVEEVRGKRRMTLVIDAVLLVTILTSLYGILQRLGYPLFDWVPGDYTRIMSFYGNPNFFGTHLVAVLPLLLALSIGSHGKRKLFSALALALALACLLFAETRSAWIGFAFSLVFLAFLIRKTKIVRFGFKTSVPLLAVFLVIILLLFLNQDVIVKRISQLWDPHGTAFMRLHTWEAAFSMIKASPIFGSGLGTFQIVFPGFRYFGFESEVPIGNVLHAHNEYLEIWAEMGILGLALFLWLMIGFFRHALRNLKGGREGLIALGMIAGIAGVLVDSLFSSSMRWTGPAFTFWFLFGLAVTTTGSEEASPKGQGRKRRGALAHVAVISAVLVCSALIVRWHVEKYMANVHVGKGLAFLDGGSKTEAIPEFRTALDNDPRSVVALYLLGCLNVEQRDFAAAEEWFRKVERLAPDFANIHEWRGYLLFHLGDLAGAEREFKICTEAKSSVFLHNMLGRIYSIQERWDLAAEQLEESCRLAEGVRKSAADASADLAAGEKVQRPIEAAAAAGAGAPRSFEEDEIINARIILAKVYYENKEHEKSIEQLQSVEQDILTKKQAISVSQLYNNIAWHYAREAENLDRALELCDKALRLSPPHPELVHDTRAWVYYRKGNLEEAEAEMKRAAGIAPENEVIQQHLLIIQRAVKGELKKIDLEEIK